MAEWASPTPSPRKRGATPPQCGGESVSYEIDLEAIWQITDSPPAGGVDFACERRGGDFPHPFILPYKNIKAEKKDRQRGSIEYSKSARTPTKAPRKLQHLEGLKHYYFFLNSPR